MLTTNEPDLSKKHSLGYTDILAKFRLALENYAKFSFASYVECECVVRNVDVYIFQRMYIESEVFFKKY